ncbi:ImmA/IrrE family metallo-endopeptidase [Fructobacillus sp. M1-13]|uniref:ImmA/IrrE family metallo-endopeptidase n=1 Tax=Fructobacillus papyriferae TaxID=2713171 RepID=A0ABS5QR12_9LACO|nr:ImmA/IrrE family metallo-endopeptidase [Fructobacillus papyriferae]MBS9335362.1 ImmA/IrrE family metallo-endopeptidase [Fructobacillus papyriferae]MCD2158970.1 ImmA/IrrE family metallo-endopeptidase [Fructobacillus papyriferae]
MLEIVNDLSDYARKKGYHIEWTYDLDPHTSSVADIQSKSIIMNGNWYRKNQLPFILAHEIGHLLTCNKQEAYISNGTLMKNDYEHNAQIISINLLLPYYIESKSVEQINIKDFMVVFDIPTYLFTECEKAIRQTVTNN